MIVKWFKYGSGDGKSAFNYLLNERVDDGTSKILKGSAALTLSIIQSLEFKKRYKSGCLSFEETNAPENVKQEIMELFEATIFPGIDEANRNIVWIEHTDKGRLELNFVIPRVELSTGKAFNPYFDRVDRKRFEACKDYINTKYGFSDPNDPSKSQRLKLGDLVKYSKAQTQKYIDSYIHKEVLKENLCNQDDVVKELEAIGYTINRIGIDYISVKTANSKAVRLKGKYYSKDWNEESTKVRPNHKKLYKTLQQEIQKASEFYQEKIYGKKPITKNKNKKGEKRNAIRLLPA